MQAADTTDYSKIYLLGQAYEGLLKYKDAHRCYKRCYELDSTRTDILNTLARVLANLGRVKEAEKYYKQVVDYDSANFYANYELARLYARLGNNAEGMRYFDHLLSRDPENAVLLRAKGDCYARMDSLDQALDCYDRAYHNNVENATLAALLINSLLHLHHPLLNNYVDVAASVCDTALFYNPENKTLRQKKAMIYYLRKDYPRADSVYTSLMSDLDSSFVTLKYCGLSRYYAQNWYDAVEPFEKALAIDTAAYDVCITLGVSLGRSYDAARALEYFDKAEKLMAPDEYWVDLLAQSRAEMHAKEGNCKKSAELYYQLWQNGKKQFSGLQRAMTCYYSGRTMSEMPDEDRQRYLFLCFLLASEASASPGAPSRSEQAMFMRHVRSALTKFDEEMFFRGLESLPMLSPDNKKNTLSDEKLKELIKKLPDK